MLRIAPRALHIHPPPLRRGGPGPPSVPSPPRRLRRLCGTLCHLTPLGKILHPLLGYLMSQLSSWCIHMTGGGGGLEIAFIVNVPAHTLLHIERTGLLHSAAYMAPCHSTIPSKQPITRQSEMANTSPATCQCLETFTPLKSKMLIFFRDVISLLARVVILWIDTATQEVPMKNIWKKIVCPVCEIRYWIVTC